MKIHSKVFFALIALIAGMSMFYAFISINFERRLFFDNLQEESQLLKSSYAMLLAGEEQNMLSLATFVAHNETIQQLFKKGRDAIVATGDHGAEAVVAARAALLREVERPWKQVQQKFTARQMHFHLGPGSTSFLRVHRPDRFGDNMDTIRHIVVDVNTDQKSRSGFELGRNYSGVRGVVPMFWTDPVSGQKEHIGAVEAGVSLEPIFKALDEKYNVGVGVVLSHEFVNQTMWREAIAENVVQPLSDSCKCYLEASSRPEIKQFLEQSGGLLKYDVNGVHTIDLNQQQYAFSYFPLQDYRTARDGNTQSIGAIILLWDVTGKMSALHQSFRRTVVYAVVGFVVLSALIWLTMWRITAGLRDEVERHTQTLRVQNDELSLAKAVFETVRDGIIVTDKDARILQVNPAVTAITGYEESELLGQSTRLFSSGRQSKQFYQDMWHALQAQGQWEGEVWNRRKDGSFFAEMLRIVAIPHCFRRDEAHFVATFSDITTRKEHEKTLEQMAFYDALTGLPNRQLLYDRLEQAISAVRRRGGYGACIYIDLDGFKSINDSWGHEAGDTVLVEVSKRLKEIIRDSDTFARMSGDEFVGILNNLQQPGDCLPMIERMLSEVSAVIMNGEIAMQVSASIGVTFFSEAMHHDAEALVHEADMAMYHSKTNGKNLYTFYQHWDKIAKGLHVG